MLSKINTKTTILTASILLCSKTKALKFSSFNAPDTPGNWNLPSTTTGFGADLGIHSLPEVNVRYHYPVTDVSELVASAENQENFARRLAAVKKDRAMYRSFLETKSNSAAKAKNPNLESILQDVPITGPIPDPSTYSMDSFMLGLQHSARPHPRKGPASFLGSKSQSSSKFGIFDPVELIPGVVSGIKAKMIDETPYTLVLHPPEESSGANANLIDSFAKIETGIERGLEAESVNAKQRLLHNELEKIDAMVANSRRKSFLQGVFGSRKADYEVDLHAPSEGKADVTADVNSILKVASSRAASGGKTDQALKTALLNAEIAKIGRIVRGMGK